MPYVEHPKLAHRVPHTIPPRIVACLKELEYVYISLLRGRGMEKGTLQYPGNKTYDKEVGKYNEEAFSYYTKIDMTTTHKTPIEHIMTSHVLNKATLTVIL